MKGRICDICGHMITGRREYNPRTHEYEDLARYKAKMSSGLFGTKLDVCQDCMSKFEDFVRNYDEYFKEEE